LGVRVRVSLKVYPNPSPELFETGGGKNMKVLTKAYRMIYKFMEGLAFALLTFIVCAVAAQVFLRALGIPVPWTEEMSRYAFVALVFVGSFLAYATGRHIVINVLVERLPKKISQILSFFVNATIAWFLVLLVRGMHAYMLASQAVRSVSVSWFQMNYLNVVLLAAILSMLGTAIVFSIRDFYSIFRK